jgi:hypothetical protein
VICDFCKKENRDSARYCSSCGEFIAIFINCPGCSLLIYKGSVFCDQCGVILKESE